LSYEYYIIYWVIPEKIHTPPTEEISAEKKKLFVIILNALGHPKGVGVPPWGWYGCFLE
jgi:hypothetical protein